MEGNGRGRKLGREDVAGGILPKGVLDTSCKPHGRARRASKRDDARMNGVDTFRITERGPIGYSAVKHCVGKARGATRLGAHKLNALANGYVCGGVKVEQLKERYAQRAANTGVEAGFRIAALQKKIIQAPGRCGNAEYKTPRKARIALVQVFKRGVAIQHIACERAAPPNVEKDVER